MEELMKEALNYRIFISFIVIIISIITGLIKYKNNILYRVKVNCGRYDYYEDRESWNLKFALSFIIDIALIIFMISLFCYDTTFNINAVLVLLSIIIQVSIFIASTFITTIN